MRKALDFRNSPHTKARRKSGRFDTRSLSLSKGQHHDGRFDKQVASTGSATASRFLSLSKGSNRVRVTTGASIHGP
ncbi:MAG: hypothetical protein LBS86_05050 [Treponema sp.]|nr:hypothetical protein [Treponema sp.]